jgi:hypothetical protein
MDVTTAWIGSIGEVGRAFDALLKGIAHDGAGTLLQPLGEWLRAYQRATHYFRALDIHEPPPHLLACAVVERALHRAVTYRNNVSPLRLAMEEVHTLLWEQVRQPDGSAAPALGPDSVSWRVAASLVERAARPSVGTNTNPATPPRPEHMRPLPDPFPAPMAPQSFEPFSLRRMLDVIAGRAPRPAFGIIGKRRDA